MNSNMRNFAIWGLITLALVALFQMFQGPVGRGRGPEISYSQFIQRVENGQVSDVVITGHRIAGKLRSGSVDGADNNEFRTVAPDDPRLVDRLLAKNVNVQGRLTDEEMPSLLSALLNWLPLLVLVGVWLFIVRQMQSGGGRAMGFGKSKAKLLHESANKVKFEDVAGVDEAKADLQQIVDFLSGPQKYQKLGARIPRGALLVGPPGTGKTLIAKAVAGEAGVPFFTISGSDFVEMFVGVGASRVRDMFEQAKKSAPCIIFIDEIDAVGRHRGAGLGGGNDEREQTLNQLLVEMDGFEANDGVIILAATNRPDVLDPALLRPGRFDRQVVVSNPDVRGREKILGVHAKKISLAPNVDLKIIARGTPGYSGADLANLINEAALLAADRKKNMVTHLELEDAKDKMMMGAERKSMAMNEEERKLTAYHESGHAIVGMFVPAGIPVHKATIIPRGRALGMVKFLPEGDRYSTKFKEYTSHLAVMMGGRVAEELTFGRENVTSGAVSDIDQATRMARSMVTRMGFSDELGMVAYGEHQEEVFLGMSMQKQQNISESTAQKIDAEVKRLVGDGYETAKRILTEQNEAFVRVAEALMEYESLTGDEIKEIIAGRMFVKKRDDEDRRGPTGPAVPAAGKRRPTPDTGSMEPQPT